MKISDYSAKYFSSNNKTLNAYLCDVRKSKVLTPEQEQELFKIIAMGGAAADKAKTEVIKCNQRFVYSLAKIYAKDEDEVLDYVNEGNFGLIEAVNTFDLSKGTKFITHAVWLIRRSMNYYLATTNNMIIKSNSMKIGKKADNVRNKFYAENGYNPTNEEVVEMIKEEYNLEVKDVSDVYDVNVASISQELDDDFTVENESEFVTRTMSINAYEYDVEKEYNNRMVGNILSSLSEKNQDIIKMFFGIGYERKYTVPEIGIKYEMADEDVIALKNAIISYLRQNKTEYRVAI